MICMYNSNQHYIIHLHQHSNSATLKFPVKKWRLTSHQGTESLLGAVCKVAPAGRWFSDMACPRRVLRRFSSHGNVRGSPPMAPPTQKIRPYQGTINRWWLNHKFVIFSKWESSSRIGVKIKKI